MVEKSRIEYLYCGAVVLQKSAGCVHTTEQCLRDLWPHTPSDVAIFFSMSESNGAYAAFVA